MPNRNGHIYPTNVLENMLGLLQTRQPIPGQMLPSFSSLRDPTYVDPQEISHQFTRFAVRDNCLVGDLEVLATSNGKILQQLLDGEVAVDFRIRGFVNQKDNTVIACAVIAFDAVGQGA